MLQNILYIHMAREIVSEGALEAVEETSTRVRAATDDFMYEGTDEEQLEDSVDDVLALLDVAPERVRDLEYEKERLENLKENGQLDEQDLAAAGYQSIDQLYDDINAAVRESEELCIESSSRDPNTYNGQL